MTTDKQVIEVVEHPTQAKTPHDVVKEFGSILDKLQDSIETFKSAVDTLVPEMPRTWKGRRAARGTEPIKTVVRDIEAVLAQGPLHESELAEALGVPEGAVKAQLTTLRRKRRLSNVGDNATPLWITKLGVEATIPALSDTIEKLIRMRPFSLKELVAATGGQVGRVSAALTRLKHMGHDVKNEGSPRRAQWHIPQG